MKKYIAPEKRFAVAIPLLIERLAHNGKLRDGLEIYIDDICRNNPLLKEALHVIGDGDMHFLMLNLQYNRILMAKNMCIRYDAVKRAICFFSKDKYNRPTTTVEVLAGEEFL